MAHIIDFDVKKAQNNSEYEVVTSIAHKSVEILRVDEGETYPVFAYIHDGLGGGSQRQFTEKGISIDDNGYGCKLKLRVKRRFQVKFSKGEKFMWDTVNENILTPEEACKALNSL